MSLTVQRLNADTTFLLTFAPPFAPTRSKRKFPGSFTILIDPWLNGASTVFHPGFATVNHTIKPTISSMTELEHVVDLIIISQDKPDHCHRATLCSLPRDSDIPILATPAAAKKVRDWKHFQNPNLVQTINPYRAARPKTVIRIPIDAYSSASADGEVTIAHMPNKHDMVGLHNAMGITYCPPGTLLTAATNGSTVSLNDMPMMSSSRPSIANTNHRFPPSPLGSPLKKSMSMSASFTALPPPPPIPASPTNPSSPSRPSTSGSRPPLITSLGKRRDNFEKVLSIIYSPHGVLPGTIRPYVTTHLALLHNALPLTMLFHSINLEKNPWYMGGNVSAGAPGGVALAREARAKNWIGAHDEKKDARGVGTKMLRTHQYDTDEVVKMLQAEQQATGQIWRTKVHVLNQGEEMKFEG